MLVHEFPSNKLLGPAGHDDDGGGDDDGDDDGGDDGGDDGDSIIVVSSAQAQWQ